MATDTWKIEIKSFFFAFVCAGFLLACGSKNGQQEGAFDYDAYDYNAVCEVGVSFLDGLRNVITEQEWSAIRRGAFYKKETHPDPSYDSEDKVYWDWLTYQHDGIEVVYTRSKEDKKIDIWSVSLEGRRLPLPLQSKKHVISLLKIKEPHSLYTSFRMGCDAIDVRMDFTGDDTTRMIVEMDTSAI